MMAICACSSTDRPAFRTDRPLRRGGFTLVEMLVAVGLVVLMMLLFAQIFSMVSASISRQRGIAQNDQSARTVALVLRGDLEKLTYRQTPGQRGIVPLGAGQVLTPSERATRRGYLHISNNEEGDILQMTVLSSIVSKNADETAYFGRAVGLPGSGPNQPEMDDGAPGNGVGSSTAAEVAYFLRRGVLYRRVLLIREPLVGSDPQPRDGPGGDGTTLIPQNYSGEFWRDFDYAATRRGGRLRFLGLNSLDNAGATGLLPIADPKHRFGFDPGTGLPRERVDNGFIGRFTHEETSHAGFDFPGRPRSGGNPVAPGTSLTLDAGGVVSAFRGGPRRGEDILLTDVHLFEIELWDPTLARFVSIGQAGTAFATSAHPLFDHQYDTWHPNIDLDGDGNADPPPFAVPLEAIRITVQFLNPATDRMRQLTIVHSFVE